ncbi:hypothetical protein [Nonomuraea roseola]|uniref:hypothetical protein n=1 Tax=Nonomuraea roseola TaxID=46179 RepID=UPI0031F9671F
MADVEEMLDQAREMPYGEARSILLEQALKAAAHDRELAFEVRLELTEAYQYGAEPAKSFATFSRSVAEYDADPGRWSDWHTYSLLWQFKWIASDMRRFPEIPLQRAYDALEEMERRYTQAGYGSHAIHTQRTYVAEHIGDRAAADEWFHRWQTTPRDDMSDCEGCDPSGKVWHLAWMGRDEEAIELAAPVVAGHLTCHVQPQGILSNLLLPYVRTGRLEAAAAAHLRAYRLVQGDANYVDDFGDHMEFCALTGNETRGLEILQRELPLLDRSPTPSDRMHFAGCAALLLRRLEDLGHGGLTVRRDGSDVPLDRLRAELESDARDLAARFDARNGTGEQTRRLEARLAAEPLVEHLPLTPHARRVAIPVTQPVAPPPRREPRRAARPGRGGLAAQRPRRRLRRVGALRRRRRRGERAAHGRARAGGRPAGRAGGGRAAVGARGRAARAGGRRGAAADHARQDRPAHPGPGAGGGDPPVAARARRREQAQRLAVPPGPGLRGGRQDRGRGRRAPGREGGHAAVTAGPAAGRRARRGRDGPRGPAGAEGRERRPDPRQDRAAARPAHPAARWRPGGTARRLRRGAGRRAALGGGAARRRARLQGRGAGHGGPRRRGGRGPHRGRGPVHRARQP